MYPKDLNQSWGTTAIPNLFNVKGKLVLITGGGRGIGLMIAQGFIENGADVIICSRSLQQIKEAAETLQAKGPGKCSYIEANVSLDTECKKVAEEISKRYGKLDVLVNNAGATWGAPFEEYPDSAFDKLFALNVKAIFNLTKYCTPLLEKGTNSTIINIGSIDGFRIPELETYAYSSSKAAVHHLTRVLANKLAPKKITVNAIAAGGFETKMMAHTLSKFRDVIVSSIPLQRIGTPADISALCIFLSSFGGSWMTGAVIVLDGGALVRSNL